MTLTEWAAWVGACSGLGGLLWNVYTKLESGPKLRMSVTPNMVRIPDARGKKYIRARVRNIGTTKTTITTMCFASYTSWWNRFRGRATGNWVVSSPSTGQSILNVGEEWNGFASQDEDIEKLVAAGNLWCEVYHSWSKKPIRARVIFFPEGK